MKNVLIIGGTARSAKKIIKSLTKNNYYIYMLSFRQHEKIYENYNWINLDLENKETIDKFINIAKYKKYSKIIFLSGNSMSKEYENISYDELKKFYESYFLNYNFLITECFKMLDVAGHMIFISSIAANKPVKDIHYSAIKSGTQALIRSLSLYTSPHQTVFSIAPGTITDDILDKMITIILRADLNANGVTFELGEY